MSPKQPMRNLIATLLIVVLAAAPVAQASACACDAAAGFASGSASGSALGPATCCGEQEACCGCCPDSEETSGKWFEEGCVCTQESPQNSSEETPDLDAPEALALDHGDAEDPRTNGAPARAPVRSTPHPGITLPLLL